MTERQANWRWGSRCKSGRKERPTTTSTASRARAPARGHAKRRHADNRIMPRLLPGALNPRALLPELSA